MTFRNCTDWEFNVNSKEIQTSSCRTGNLIWESRAQQTLPSHSLASKRFKRFVISCTVVVYLEQLDIWVFLSNLGTAPSTRPSDRDVLLRSHVVGICSRMPLVGGDKTYRMLLSWDITQVCDKVSLKVSECVRHLRQTGKIRLIRRSPPNGSSKSWKAMRSRRMSVNLGCTHANQWLPMILQ